MLGTSELAQGYEDLRTWALGCSTSGGVARGLALLLRGGMPAWMQAWLHYIPATAARPAPKNPPASARAAHVPGLEVAQVLANMVLLGRGRVRA